MTTLDSQETDRPLSEDELVRAEAIRHGLEKLADAEHALEKAIAASDAAKAFMGSSVLFPNGVTQRPTNQYEEAIVGLDPTFRDETPPTDPHYVIREKVRNALLEQPDVTPDYIDFTPDKNRGIN